MTSASYPAARTVAPLARLHFAGHHETERGRDCLAPKPDDEVIEAMVDAAFWASLRQEESFSPKISLAWLPPSDAGVSITFERRLPLTPQALTHLAPAVERPGIHLGVWREDDHFYVWGATRNLPPLCFVLEVVDPGLLVIKHRRSQESGKFVNVAVLEGQQVKVLDHAAAGVPDIPAVVASLLGFDSPRCSAQSTNVLIQLASSMRAHKRGGALLLVPSANENWKESIVGPTRYAVQPSYGELADLIRQEPDLSEERRWQDALRRAIDAVAGLTAVDGALVLTDQCNLLAFGAKIGRRHGHERLDTLIEIEPIQGSVPRSVHPSQLGGTRHLSAAQFVHDQRDSIALVASQDGRFTIFAWSRQESTVQAYRVEALLL